MLLSYDTQNSEKKMLVQKNLPPQLVQDVLVNEMIEIIFYSLTQEGNKENHLDLCLPHSSFPILLSCCCLVPRQALCSQRLL